MKFTTLFTIAATAMYVAASPVADNFDMSPVKREDNLLEKRDMRCSVVRNQKCNWGPGSKSSARTTIKPSHGVFGVRCICPQENYIWGWIPGWGCFTTVPGLKCQSSANFPKCSHDQCY